MIWRIPATEDPKLGTLTEVTEHWSFEDLMQAHNIIDEFERVRREQKARR